MQTSVQRQKALRFGSGILEVSEDNGNTRLNLWALKEGKLWLTFKISEIIFDNAKLPPKAKIEEAIFSARLAEIHLANVYKLMTLWVLTVTPWVLVSVTQEVLLTMGSTWNTETPLFLDNQNWNETAVTITWVNIWVTPLILNTDYKIIVENGRTAIVRIWSNLLIATDDLTIDYTYTPNASQEILYSDILQSLSRNRFRFTNYDEFGKKFGIEIFEWYNKSWFEFTFVADEDTENVMELPIELKAFPVAWTNQLFRVFDEQDA